MTKQTYDALSDKEKLLYDEFNAFGQRMADRMEEVSELLKTLITMIQEVE